MQLILFPYAGASGSAYRALADQLPASWDIQTLELPGRGQRIREPLCTNVTEMVDDLCGQLGVLEEPAGFFGHSMGSVLAYLVARRLHAENHRLPDFMICSGFRALHLPHEKPMKHRLDSKAFREALRKIGGMPAQILDDEDVMDFFEPMIRTDFKISEEFVLNQPQALPLPIYTFFGTEEHLTEKEKEAWGRLSTKPVRRHDFRGNHFFIFSSSRAVCRCIESIAQTCTNTTVGNV